MDLEARYCARNYNPLPVILTRGEGLFVGVVIGEMDELRLAS